MFTQIFNVQLLVDALGSGGTVLILAGLGYLFTDRAGVFNIAIEGLLLFSAFFAAAASGTSGNVWLGLAGGIGSAVVVSVVFFAVGIGLRADIIVVGIAVNLLAGGVTVFLLNQWFGVSGNYQPESLQTIPAYSLPGLDSIPGIGAAFTNQNVLSYVAILLVPLAHLILYRTPLGLHIRSVGENPEAAETVGISVHRTQFIAVIICGILSGLGGCFLSIGPLGGFNRDMSAGQGWIALAAETLGRGTPVGTLASCLFYGASQGVSYNMQAAGIGAGQLAQAIPYAVTVIGLAIAARGVVIRRRRPARGSHGSAPV